MSVTAQLEWCLKHGQLTVADLAHWFSRPHMTVKSWLVDGREPRGPQGVEALRRLALLREAIRQRQFFPVDAGLSQHARPEYITKAYGQLSRGISKGRAS